MARDGAAVELTDEALAAIDRARAVGRGARGRADAGVRHLDRLRRPGDAAHPRPSCASSCSARWSARTPPARVPRWSARSCAALMLLRLSTLATGHTGVRRETAQLLAALLNAGITPVVREYGSLGCSGDLAPLAHCRAGADGRGRGARRRRRAACRPREALPPPASTPVELRSEGGPRADQRHRRHARHAGRWPCTTCGLLLAHRRHRGGDDASRGSWAPTGSSPPICRRCGRIRARRAPPPTCRALLAGSDDRLAASGPTHHRVQDAYSLRCSPQVHGAARDTARPRRDGRRPRARQRDRQPGRRRRRRPGRSPTATSTVRRSPTSSTSWRSWPPTSPRSVGAAHRPVPRRRAQPRPAAVPRRRPRRRQRPHDRAVHAGRDRLRAQAPGRAGQRRLDPLAARCRRTTSRWAGRPPASCGGRSTGSPGCWPSSC